MRKKFEPPLTPEEISNFFPDIINIKLHKPGGEGVVFKGFDKNTKKEVAIKIYYPGHVKTRTEREIYILNKIECQSLIKIYGFGSIPIRSEECYFTVCDFINGIDLETYFSSGNTLTQDETVSLIISISSAIEYLWKHSVVHCDITPKNIIKTPEGQFILIDLGIAKHHEFTTITQQGTIMGTRGYIAPEQFRGRKNLTLRADYYSLGIVAYQALAGFHPYSYAQELMLKVPLPDFPPYLEVNSALKNTIKKMTEIVPYRRPGSLREIITLLKGE